MLKSSMYWRNYYRLNPTQANRAMEMFRAFPNQKKIEEALKEIIDQFGRWDRVVYVCRLYRAILVEKYVSELGEKLARRYKIYQADDTPYDADELGIFIEDLKHFIGNAEVQNYTKILSFTFGEQDPKEILHKFQEIETAYQEQRKDEYIPVDAEPLILKSKFRYKYLHEFTQPAEDTYLQLEQEIDFDKLIEKTRDLRSKGLIRRWRKKRAN